MSESVIKPIDTNKQTVLVLGAGASAPYGFPLGNQLKIELISNLKDAGFQVTLKQNGFDEVLVKDFSEALSGTYHQTIDIFLEKKKRFRECGSFLIARALMPHENHEMLFPENNWYAHLYHALNFENINQSPDTRNIQIVSLNYDRSLEHFLINNIKYNCPDDVYTLALTKFELLKIIHAHGSLGDYPDIPYGSNNGDISVLSAAANRIRIISDRLQDTADFRNAQEAIRNADNIVFIGFGYDPKTLELLISNVDTSKKRIIGTVFGLQQERLDLVREFFKGGIEIIGTGVTAEKLVKIILPIKNIDK